MDWPQQTFRLLVLLLSLSIINLSSAVIEQQGGYLNSPSSFISLISENWKIQDNVERLVTAVRVTPTSWSGQIMTLRALSPEGQVKLKLSVYVVERILYAKLYDGEDNILSEPSEDVPIKMLEEQSIAVTIDQSSKQLMYRVQRDRGVISDIVGDIDWKDTVVDVTLGGSNNSITGCVSLITVQIGDGDAFSHVVLFNNHDTDRCETEQSCSERNCGRGNCIEEVIATCDCYGTGLSGPSCENEAPTIELNNSGEDAEASYIFFKPSNERQIRRIAMQFKFKGSNEGVLLYGHNGLDFTLKMFVVGSLGTIQENSHTIAQFQLQPDRTFHSVEFFFKEDLNFNIRILHLTVDDVKQQISGVSRSLIDSLTFGAEPAKNGVSDVGLTGCLKEIYVDHLDIIRLTYDRDPRINTTKPPMECTRGNDIENESILMTGISLMNPELLPSNTGSHMDSEEDDGETEITTTRKQPQILQCENAQKSLCRNKADCQVVGGNVTCLCLLGYTGSFCQFVLLPRTCSESQTFLHQRDGPTMLDVDGSEKLSYSVATCKDGKTIIPNNMPNDSLIRDTEPQHWIVRLAYLDFLDHLKLTQLIENSFDCQQTVNYTCNRAPLRFDKGQTFFRVATGNQTVSQIGRDNGTCECHDFHNCLHDGNCHCDAGGNSEDSGVLHGKQAGITEIVALYMSGSVSGKFSVGPLECSGFAGELENMQFTQKSHLPIFNWGDKKSFSMQFKTSNNEGILLTIGRDVVIELTDAYSLKASSGDEHIVLGSQTKLNNSQWHLLRVEWRNNEMLLSVDGYNTVTNKIPVPTEGYVILNDIENGFFGCVRSVFMDGTLVPIKNLAINQNFDYKPCSEHCNHISCQNDAECVEDYQKDEASCRCVHPEIQSGATCEIDINQESSVSFHGGYLAYENISNPMVENTVFSFRTDQSNALLFYAHDHLRNFIQVHLREEVNLTLTLNRDRTIHTCTLTAPNGDEFSHMQWIQISIKHVDNEYTQLRVGDEACIIRVPLEPATTLITQYLNWNKKDAVELPVGLNPMVVADPTLKVFVGGVTNFETGDEAIHKLRPNYRTKLPNLLGCLRGLKVGQQVVSLRHTSAGIRPEDPSLVRKGCDVGCDTLTCYNGGHCSIGWRNYDPSASKTKCDCIRTSYAGESCTDDDGLLLSDQNVIFEISNLLRRYVEPPLRGQSFKFAFSPDPAKLTSRQVIAVLYVEYSWLEVLLNKNSSLNVAIHNIDGRVQVLTFNGNFTDGYRHFFVARFAPNMPTSVMVDSSRQTFAHDTDSFLDLRSTQQLQIGQKSQLDTSEYKNHIIKKNYEGCISNIELNVAEGTKSLEFNVLDHLDDPYITKSSETLTRGRCSAFRIPNQPPVLQNPLNLPEFHAVFTRSPFKLTEENPFTSDSESTSSIWYFLLIFVLSFILTIIFCILCYCFCKRCRSRKEHDSNPYSSDEMIPLPTYKTRIDGPIGNLESSYHIPPPDVDLLNRPHSAVHAPLIASSSPREELSSDDEDKTIVADDDNYFNRSNNSSIRRPNSFNRSSPQRMSSFRNDPTAPLGSPLRGYDPKERMPVPVATPVAPTSP